MLVIKPKRALVTNGLNPQGRYLCCTGIVVKFRCLFQTKTLTYQQFYHDSHIFGHYRICETPESKEGFELDNKRTSIGTIIIPSLCKSSSIDRWKVTINISAHFKVQFKLTYS